MWRTILATTHITLYQLPFAWYATQTTIDLERQSHLSTGVRHSLGLKICQGVPHTTIVD